MENQIVSRVEYAELDFHANFCRGHFEPKIKPLQKIPVPFGKLISAACEAAGIPES